MHGSMNIIFINAKLTVPLAVRSKAVFLKICETAAR